jgi:tagatose-1,6-bisphosphate aldolase
MGRALVETAIRPPSGSIAQKAVDRGGSLRSMTAATATKPNREALQQFCAMGLTR